MSGKSAIDMELLDREAAQAVVGPGVIDDVQVRPGWTFDNEPTVEFYFRVDPDRVPIRPGLIHIRLHQQLQDRMIGAENSELRSCACSTMKTGAPGRLVEPKKLIEVARLLVAQGRDARDLAAGQHRVRGGRRIRRDRSG